MATLATEKADVPASDTRLGQRWRWLPTAIVLTCYTLLSVLVMARMWVDPDHRVPPGHEPDPNLFKWFIAYAARAVTHFENPFFTTMQGYPDGVNLMGNTSVLGLGIPFTPVTLLFGAGVSFNAMLTLGFAGTAAGWYYVLRRHLSASRLAAAIGGGLCAFAPALVAHALGHLHMTFQVLIPFIVSFVLRLREGRRPIRDGVILGVLIAYQALIGEEVLLLTAMGLGVFVAVYAAFNPAVVRVAWRPMCSGLGIAAAISAVLLAYPLWMQFFGPQSYHGLDPAAQGFGANVKAYTTFATQTLFGDRAANAGLAQNYAEENSFFGWPLALLTVVFAMWMWRHKLVWVLAIVGGVFAVFSLSVNVRAGGQLLTTHGPWGLLSPLPVLDAVIPTRFAIIVIPVIAVVLTLGIDRLRALKMPAVRVAGFVAIGLVLLTVVPTPLPGGSQSAVPRFITAGMWKPYVADGHTLVTLPLSSPEQSATLRWAAAANVGYAIPRGYFLAPDKGEPGAQGTFWQPERYFAKTVDEVVRTGVVPEISDVDRSVTREDLRFWSASVLVMDRKTAHAEAIRATVDELVGPGVAVADVYVWDVRSLVG